MMVEYIGPFGRLFPFRGPQAMESEHEREFETSTLADGRTVMQRATRSRRTWSWEIPHATTDEIKHLIALENGTYGRGPWRWYDSFAATQNMFDEVVASAGYGAAPWRWFAPNATYAEANGPVEVDGHYFAASLRTIKTLRFPTRAGQIDPVPVIPGRSYTASLYVFDIPEGSTAYAVMVFVDLAGSVILEVEEETSTSQRIVLTGEAPANAAGVFFTLQAGTSDRSLALARTGAPGYVTTPVNPALALGNEVDLRIGVDLADVAISDQQFITQFQEDTEDVSFTFRVRGDGRLAFRWSEDGSPFGNQQVLSPGPVDPGSNGYRVVWRGSDLDQSGSRSVRFYQTFTDGQTWSPLGPVALGNASSLWQSTATPIAIGAIVDPDLWRLQGSVRWAEIRSVEDGPLLANPDFTELGPWQGGDTAGQTRPDAQGIPWTLGGDAVIIEDVIPDGETSLTGLQLTEGTEPIEWVPGMGIPRVMFSGLGDHSYTKHWRPESLRNVTIDLTEVA